MYRSQNLIGFLLGFFWLLPIFSQESDKPSRQAAWEYLNASGEVEIVTQNLEKNLAALSAFYKNQEAEISATRAKLKKELFEKMIEAVVSTYQPKELTEITQFLKSRSGRIWKDRNKDYRTKFDASAADVMNNFTQQIHKSSHKAASDKVTAEPDSPLSESSDSTKASEKK